MRKERRMMTARLVSALVLALSCESRGAAVPQISGYFSDIHLANGDLLGLSVWIVRSDEFWATVQIAQGHAGVPLVGLVHAEGQRVRFAVEEPVWDAGGHPAPPVKIEFTGVVSNTGLKLDTGEFLARRNSWQ